MYSIILQALRDWNQNNSERNKLQHAYVAAAVSLIVAAGLIGLVDYDLGQRLTTVALIALGVYFINLVVWTLLHGIVLMRLSVEQKTSKKPARKTKR